MRKNNVAISCVFIFGIVSNLFCMREFEKGLLQAGRERFADDTEKLAVFDATWADVLAVYRDATDEMNEQCEVPSRFDRFFDPLEENGIDSLNQFVVKNLLLQADFKDSSIFK